MADLKKYQDKRDFESTGEPEGRPTSDAGDALRFVVQKHAARRLHYDLRLEMEGVLRSWAIPRGPSLDPSEKRLAVHTEDHPLEYLHFEGVIPTGQYGAGNMIVWDQGSYQCVGKETHPVRAWQQGTLDLRLYGEKLQGHWVLVKIKGSENDWLLIKKDDPFADPQKDLLKEMSESVLSGLEVEELVEGVTASHRHRHQRLLSELQLEPALLDQVPAPMLPSLVQKVPAGTGWLYELKYDGFRALAGKKNGKIRLLSRNLKRLDQHFQELLPCLLALPAENFLLDGEIVIFDSEGRSRFQSLQSRLGIGARSQSKEETGPARYLVFDVLSCDGFDLREVTLSERRRILEALVPQSELIKKVDVLTKQGESFFRLVAKQGLEGIVAKQAGSCYVSGRSSRWLKIKATREQSFVIGGFTAPSKSRNHFGALAIGLFDEDRLRFVGKVGGGFNAETLRTVYDQVKSLHIEEAPFQEIPREIAGAEWVKPTLVCDVKFNEWTRDWILRAPVFLKLRPELDATECRFEGGPDSPAAGSSEDDGLEQYDFLSNLDKPFWAREGYTKRDLVDYYHRIAPVLLPYLKDRPLNLERYPDGYEGKSCYQKDAPDLLPEWIDTAVVPSGSKGKANRHVLCNDRRSLVYLANLACIPLHPWSSRAGSIEFPDFMIIDLDPGEGVPFPAVCQLALTVKEILGQLSLNGYPKTSGSKGLHVVVPLDSRHDYKSVRRFAEVIARLAVHSMGDLDTIERGMEKRKGKIYIDYLQNGFGKTIVSPYCLRPRPGAPVSTPLNWSEVSSSIRPQAFNIRSTFRRLAAKGDPFQPLLTEKQSLQCALQQLEELFSDGSP